ncbi:hypothetical protein FSP39_007513, partial [Pinctada imbricata]
ITLTVEAQNMALLNISSSGNVTDDDVITPESLQITRLVVQRILSPLIVICGVIGNLFNIIVLCHRKMRNSTNVYLMYLAICDTLYLIFMFVLSFVDCNKENMSFDAFHYIPYGRMASDLFGNSAVWLTVVFTLERFFGVCYPMKGKTLCTVKKARVVSLLVFVLCLCNTIPNLFEIEVKEYEFNNTEGYILRCEASELSKRKSYSIGFYWWYVTFFSVLPFTFLFIFNSMLIKSVWDANKRRQLLANSRVIGENPRQTMEQQRVTIMLITVVVIFLVCQLPWTVLLLFRVANDIAKPSITIRILGNICNLLVQINASVNFLLYSYFSSKFRRTFKGLFCAWRRPKTSYSKCRNGSDMLRKSTSSKENTTVTDVSTYRSNKRTDLYRH